MSVAKWMRRWVERVRSRRWLAGARSARDNRAADVRQAQRAVGRRLCPDCGTPLYYDIACPNTNCPTIWTLGTAERAQARKRDASVPANTKASERGQ